MPIRRPEPLVQHHSLTDRKIKHYRTEVVASNVEMLSGRKKKDYAAETAAEALESQG
jgi:hypothetical protein